MSIREMYQPIALGVNASSAIKTLQVAGFLCVTSGSLTITSNAETGTFTLISSLPVVAGSYYPMPFYLGANGGTVTLAGGASGVLGV